MHTEKYVEPTEKLKVEKNKSQTQTENTHNPWGRNGIDTNTIHKNKSQIFSTQFWRDDRRTEDNAKTFVHPNLPETFKISISRFRRSTWRDYPKPSKSLPDPFKGSLAKSNGIFEGAQKKSIRGGWTVQVHPK